MSEKIIPYEEDEQIALAEYLDWNNYTWCHVSNEGKHKVQYRKKQAKLGVKPGVPDILIFDNLGVTDCTGIAIELKRKKGGQLSKYQKEWLQKLKDRGWETKVAKGADDAIEFLKGLKGTG